MEPGRHPERSGNRREDVAQRPAGQPLCGVLRLDEAGDRACHRQFWLRAERLSANTRRSSTAPWPSAAELTRSEKSSETTMPV